jgi:hypothetical protein
MAAPPWRAGVEVGRSLLPTTKISGQTGTLCPDDLGYSCISRRFERPTQKQEEGMGLLSRRRNVLDELTSELAKLGVRRDLLSKQLTAVEGKIDEALANRRAHLLEGDLDAPNGELVIIERLRDEKSAVVDALAAIDAKALDAQRRLDEERDRLQRQTASKELSSAADQLDAVATDLAGVVARIPVTLAAVLDRLPAPYAVAPERIKAFGDGLVEALQAEEREGRAYAARLAAGDGVVVPPRVEEAEPPPAPAIERLQIFPLQASKWVETDGSIVTVGAHVGCSPPIEVARAALANGTALDPLSDEAIVLRQRCPPRYGHYPPQDCIDLNAPRPEKLPAGSKTITSPSIHSAFVGPARVGTAVAR